MIEGTTCEEAGLVGDHYWNSNTFPSDNPWNSPNVYAVTDSSGNANGSFSIYSGYGYEENINHALVLHDSTGIRVACGVLLVYNSTTLVANMGNYPLAVYYYDSPDWAASGQVYVTYTSDDMNSNERMLTVDESHEHSDGESQHSHNISELEETGIFYRNIWIGSGASATVCTCYCLVAASITTSSTIIDGIDGTIDGIQGSSNINNENEDTIDHDIVAIAESIYNSSPYRPSNSPTTIPSVSPTYSPTEVHSDTPSLTPTVSPSSYPTVYPTNTPSTAPSILPTVSYHPTLISTLEPSSSEALSIEIDPLENDPSPSFYPSLGSIPEQNSLSPVKCDFSGTRRKMKKYSSKSTNLSMLSAISSSHDSHSSSVQDKSHSHSHSHSHSSSTDPNAHSHSHSTSGDYALDEDNVVFSTPAPTCCAWICNDSSSNDSSHHHSHTGSSHTGTSYKSTTNHSRRRMQHSYSYNDQNTTLLNNVDGHTHDGIVVDAYESHGNIMNSLHDDQNVTLLNNADGHTHVETVNADHSHGNVMNCVWTCGEIIQDDTNSNVDTTSIPEDRLYSGDMKVASIHSGAVNGDDDEGLSSSLLTVNTSETSQSATSSAFGSMLLRGRKIYSIIIGLILII